MKLLISLFLTVVCVHCIPLYDDDGKGSYKETHTSHMSGYNGTVHLRLGGTVGYKNGTVVLKTDNNIGPDFLHYNDSHVRTYDRPADTTPPPPNAASTICGESCLIPPTYQWSMQNRPWVMPNNPSSMVINQRDMPNGQLGMSNNPSGQLSTQWVVPNKQLVFTNYPSGWSNYPIYATSNVAPNGAPNDMSQQYLPYGPNYPSGWPNYQIYATSNVAPNGAPNDMSQQNPSYGPNNQLGWSNYPTYPTSNGATNGALHDMSQQNPSYAQRSIVI